MFNFEIILSDKFINLINNSKKCSFELRNKIGFFLILFTFFYFMFNAYQLSIPFSLNVLICSILIFLTIMCHVDKTDKCKNSKLYIYLTRCIGLDFLVMGIFFHLVGYVAYFVIFTLIVPELFIIGANVSIKRILNNIANAGCFASLFFIIVSLLFYPLSNLQYGSLFNNPNSLGINLSIYIVCVIYKIITSKSKYRYILLLGILITFVLLSESRTCLLTVIVSFILYGLFLIKNKLFSIRRAIFLLMAVLITYVTFSFFLLTVTPSLEKSLNQSEIFKKNTEIVETTFSDKLVSLYNKETKGLANDSGRFTSGRAAIWKAFIKEIRITGHKQETIIGEIDSSVPIERDAHNTILQISYSGGIIAGMAFTGIIIKAIVDCVCMLRPKKKYNDFNFVKVSLIFSFIIASSLGAMYSPFSNISSYLFWISLSLLLNNEIGENVNEDFN